MFFKATSNKILTDVYVIGFHNVASPLYCPRGGEGRGKM